MNKKLLLIAFISMILSVSFGAFLSEATETEQDNKQLYKYYTNIQIQKGDTLWAIANEYAVGDIISNKDYVEQVKKINSILNDDIRAGDYITIFYYSADKK
jgi:Predicted periplasmic solute-binding protein